MTHLSLAKLSPALRAQAEAKLATAGAPVKATRNTKREAPMEETGPVACRGCTALWPHYGAAVERHSDETGHRRIEVLVSTIPHRRA